MPLWREQDDAGVVSWHLMAEGAHGQPREPLCGRSTGGLRFDAETTWAQLPERARCAGCVAVSRRGS